MLDKTKLKDFIQSRLDGTDCFLTELNVTPDNVVRVEIDSDSRVDLDFCVELNRAIEQEFPSDEEDYELEVGSAGLTSPLKLPRQYRKYIGRDLEVYTAGGRKLTGLLREVDEEGITLVVKVKKREEGAKRPIEVEERLRLPYAEIRKAVYLLKF